MSRTPETIVNKTAVTIRNVVIGAGVLAWLIAWGSFLNEDQSGQGIICILIGLGLFWVAAKIKTHHRKRGEVGIYD